MLNGDVTKDNLDGIIRSIAAALRVDPSLIEILGSRRQSSRRAPVSITFRLFVDADKKNEISALIESGSFSNNLAMELGRQNIQASVVSTGPFPCYFLLQKCIVEAFGSSKQVPAAMCSLTRFFGVCRKDTNKLGARDHVGGHNLPR